jgi:hypothetical protein
MTSKVSFILLATLSLTCVFLVGLVGGQSRETCLSSNDYELVEAVFRYQLDQHTQQKKWKLFYLAYGLSPDDDECVQVWVKTFSHHNPPVLKFKKSEFDVERIKEEHGLVLGVAGVKRKTETEAEVEGYSFVVPGEAQGFRFSLIRENGQWFVKSSKGMWIA